MEPNQTVVNPDNNPAPLPTPEPSSPVTPPAPQIDVAPSPLDFIPESYRQAPWVQKYKSPDDFFKGVDNMAKLIGQKQIVQGIVPPGENATEEDYNNFFNQIGRPESPDKYALPEVELPEGFDLAGEKKVFSNLAHKAGLNQKQSEILFKEYAETIKQEFIKSEQESLKSFESAVKEAFPEDTAKGYELAKKAANTLGVGSKLDEVGLSKQPLVLQLLAKIGELTKEDSFVKPGSASSKETELEEARRLQKSPEYWKDPAVQRRVEEIYKRAFPEKG